MAKVMVSIPDELLARIDAEARRQGTTRSGLLQKVARTELDSRSSDRKELRTQIEALRGNWKEPHISAEDMVRADRRSH